ncbi:PUA-like domain-containing protein [Radiomyces spectabilis]|uniref:PUA-like domain-containing protein n=1 Tax=Radiomyces spectabilis TaxID=64574 RepID=UPI00221F64EE|nr:PUA-like domain-containing protein [Radiomyces spectabilis]KAI8384791.1 PUA-like domain-containing protein [Radiomyces spectabilis]
MHALTWTMFKSAYCVLTYAKRGIRVPIDIQFVNETTAAEPSAASSLAIRRQRPTPTTRHSPYDRPTSSPEQSSSGDQDELGTGAPRVPRKNKGWLIQQNKLWTIAPSGRYRRLVASDIKMADKSKLESCFFGRDYQGHLPHVPVGYRTELRLQMSSIGIHRPTMAGIYGSQSLGKVLSIVMSGDYPEDEDYGDEFYYAGSGGREKQSGVQTFNQELTRSNLLLAKSCKAKLDTVMGADAGDRWREGAPIRVVRGRHQKQHVTRFDNRRQNFAPSEGYRYDGIYKVVRYWPETGHTGHIVWRFFFRRDDPHPAPWTSDGMTFSRRHCRAMLKAERNEKRVQSIYSFCQVLPYFKPPRQYSRRNETKAYGSTSRQMDRDDVNDEITNVDIEIGAYKPSRPLMEALKMDQMNKRLWLRLLNKAYQEQQHITDDLFFIEALLMQPELQCLLCNVKGKKAFSEVTIPLVHHESYHCTRCDYNFCSKCIKSYLAAKWHVCPNCLSRKSLCTNTRLKYVYETIGLITLNQ